MLRGLLSGTVTGGVLAAAVLATTSLVSPPPPGNRPPLAPEVTAPDLPEGAGALTTDAADAIPDGSRDQGGAPQPSDTPTVSSPTDTPAAISALPDADTAPPAVPQTGDADRAIAEPSAPRTAPTLGTATDGPITIAPPTDSPAQPSTEAAPAAETESGVPLAEPRAVGTDAPDLGAPDAVPDEEAGAGVTIAAADTAPAPAALPDGPADPGTPEAEAGVALDSGTAEPLAETGVAADPSAPERGLAPAAPAAADGPDVTTDAPAIASPAVDDLPPATPQPVERVLVEVPAVEPETVPDVVEDEPVTAEAPAAVDEPTQPAPEVQAVVVEPTAPRIALQGDGSSLPTGDDGIRVLRPGSDVSEDAAAEETTAAPVDPNAPAIVAHAADWDAESTTKPLLSIVLIDDGSLGAAGQAALSELTFPVTVALDATVAGASENEARYREAGFEIMAMAPLPEGATPQDAEVILGAAFDLLPNTIGLFDPGNGGLQSDRNVTEIAMARLADDGRAFVTASQGLNMALRTAEAAGVPAGVLYRDLDSEGQSAQVIRRFLDQAAFRARQQSGVILVARMRPDTLSALSLWGTANRAGQVDIAPASVVLRALADQ